jgi:hypothetical protein
VINYFLVGPGERYDGTDMFLIVIYFWDERSASDESLLWERFIGLLEIGEDAPVVRAHPLFIELGVGYLVVIKHGIQVRHPLLDLIEHLVHGHHLTKYVERPGGAGCGTFLDATQWPGPSCCRPYRRNFPARAS